MHLDDDNSSSDQSAPSMTRTSLTVCMYDLSDDECETKIKSHMGYKKVLVTGGAGFIGSNVAEYLLERGDDVVIIHEMNEYYDVRIKESNIALLRAKYHFLFGG